MERNYEPIMEIQIGFAYSIARKLTFTEPIFITTLLANPSSDFLHPTLLTTLFFPQRSLTRLISSSRNCLWNI
jgi:hypothetical protein